jgi:RimJ/RimL family protein N-acetyltransferase
MLVGKRVILRTLREADLDLLYDLSADLRHMGDYWPLGMPSEIRWKNRLRESGWWEKDHGGLLVTDLEDRILGQVVFYKAMVYMNGYELGFRIYQPQDWGQGYMSEAVSLAVSFLFQTRPIDRIQATTMLGNGGSQRVLLKNGFQHEGTLRQAVFHQGQGADLHLYSILRGEHLPLADLLG